MLTSVMGAPKLANRDVSSFVLTASSHSKMAKQKSQALSNAESAPARPVVPLAPLCAIRKQLSFRPARLQVVVHQNWKLAKTCFGKQNAPSAERHIGQIVQKTSALTAPSIPSNSRLSGG
jgi:hypothetical protein